MIIDFKKIDPRISYRLLTHTVTPRPVAWVLTDNGNDSVNVAPFSYFNIVSADPGILMFSVGYKRDGSKKDTWVNLERDAKCVVHIASQALVGQLNESARALDFGVSELDGTDLTLVNEPNLLLPRIAEAPVAFFAELSDIHLVGNGPQAVFYVEVVSTYLDDALIDRTTMTVNTGGLDPLSRLGGDDYASLGDVTTLKRPGHL